MTSVTRLAIGLVLALLLLGGGCRWLRSGGPAVADPARPASHPVASPASTGAIPAPAAAESLEGAPVVPLLRDYRVLAHYRIAPAQSFGDRADFSGITIRADRKDVQIWMCEDKAQAASAIFFTFIQVPRQPVVELRELRPTPMPILNPGRLRAGEDIEDLAWVPSGDARVPAALVMVGEQGPNGESHSWRYRFDMLRDGLALRETGAAPAPPLETTNNDGLEGVAARRLADSRLEVYTFKERSGRIYTVLDTLAANADPVLMPAGWTPPSPRTTPRFLEIPGMSTQSGATFRSGPVPELFVIDRLRRRLAVVPVPSLSGPPATRLAARLWYDFAAVDSLLEGRSGDTPGSLFGACEGVAEDSAGRLYLLSDNNEANNSRLVLLERRPAQN